MSILKPIQLDPNTTIWIEATENTEILDPNPVAHPAGTMVSPSPVNGLPENGSEPVQRRVDKGLGDWMSGNNGRGGGATQVATSPAADLQAKMPRLDTTIKSYTQYALQAFRDTALTEVKKVTLEFGVNLSGMSGVPYIATGTVGCNIKVTVECQFPDRASDESS